MMRSVDQREDRCCTCNKIYIGETGRRLGDRFREHLRSTRQANARRNGFFGGSFLFSISELTQRERICSFRKLQIFISQTTDFHIANYRFPFRFVPLRFVPFRFVPFRFANYSKPFFTSLKHRQISEHIFAAKDEAIVFIIHRF